MEEIYLKQSKEPPQWCSEYVQAQPYFNDYSKDLELFKNKKISDNDIIKFFCPDAKDLDKKQLLELAALTDPARLTRFYVEDLEDSTQIESSNKPSSSEVPTAVPSTSSMCIPSTSTAPASVVPEDICVDKLESLEITAKGTKKRPPRRKSLFKRYMIQLDAAKRIGKKDLSPLKDILITVRIFEPFRRVIGKKTRRGRCNQEFDMLGCQKLSDLKDKIMCEQDYQDVRGEISDQPDPIIPQFTRDLYPASMFYINNTFYGDFRNCTNTDLTPELKKWAKDRGIELGATYAMELVRVDQMWLRYGYPYVYVHQGFCEHLVVFSEARLLNHSDSAHSSDYPLLKKIARKQLIYCYSCNKKPAIWVMLDNDKAINNPDYQCDRCFKSLRYINGQKIGNFKAYRYTQRATIM